MFGRTKELDHETRVRDADEVARNAMALFETAATGLEVAAQAHLSVVSDLDAEISRLVALRRDSKMGADDALKSAKNIRGLIGGSTG